MKFYEEFDYDIESSVKCQLISKLHRLAINGQVLLSIRNRIFSQVLIPLVKKCKDWDAKGLTLEWENSLELIRNSYFRSKTGSKAFIGHEVVQQYRTLLFSYVRKVRKWRSVDDGNAIYHSLKSQLNQTINDESFLALGLLSLFCPVLSATHMTAWISIWQKIQNCKKWDILWMKMMSKAAKFTHEWDAKSLKWIFSKILQVLLSAAGTTTMLHARTWNKHFDVFTSGIQCAEISAKLTIHVVSNVDDMSYFQRLMSMIEFGYHPAAVGKHRAQFGVYLATCTKYFCKWVGRQHSTAEKDSQRDKRVMIHASFLKLALYGIYSPDSALARSCQRALRNLSSIHTKTVAASIIGELKSVMQDDTLKHAHRRVAIVQTLAICLPHFLYPIPHIAQFLPDILQWCTEEIAPHNAQRSVAAMLLFQQFLHLAPIGSSSNYTQQNPDIANRFDVSMISDTTEGADQYASNALLVSNELDSWALMFLEKLLKVYQLRELRGMKIKSITFGLDIWDIGFRIVMPQLTTLVFVQSIGSIQNQLGRKVCNAVEEKNFSCPQDMMDVVHACSANGSANIRAQLLDVAFHLVSSLKEKEDQACLPDVCHGLRILTACIKNSAGRLLPRFDEINNIAEKCMSSKHPEVSKIGEKLLKNHLKSLLSMYPIDHRSLSPTDVKLSEASKEYSQYWGKKYTPSSVETQWYTNTLEAEAAVLGFVKRHVKQFAESIKNLMDEKSIVVKAWRKQLNALRATIRGCVYRIAPGCNAKTSEYYKEWQLIKTNAMRSCFDAITYWLAMSESREVKSMVLILKIIQELFGLQVKHRHGINSILKQSLSAINDPYYAVKAKGGTLSTADMEFTMLARHDQVSKIFDMYLKQRICLQKFECHHAQYDLNQVELDILKAIFECCQSSYEKIRARGAAMLENVPSMYANVEGLLLELAFESLFKETNTADQLLGVIKVLSSKECRQQILSTDALQRKFLEAVCFTIPIKITKLPMDRQKSVQMAVQKWFESICVRWDCGVSASTEKAEWLAGFATKIIAMQSSVTWQTFFTALFCLLLSGPTQVVFLNDSVRECVSVAIHSDMQPIRKLGLFLLGYGMENCGEESQLNSLMKENGISKKVCEIFVQDHNIAFVSVNGEGPDRGPKMWPSQVTFAFKCLNFHFSSLMFDKRSYKSQNFSEVHRRLCTTVFVTMDIATHPHMLEMVQSTSDERHASKCTVVEIIAGTLSEFGWETKQSLVHSCFVGCSPSIVDDLIYFMNVLGTEADMKILPSIIKMLNLELSKSFRGAQTEQLVRWIKLLQSLILGISNRATLLIDPVVISELKDSIALFQQHIGWDFAIGRIEISKALVYLHVYLFDMDALRLFCSNTMDNAVKNKDVALLKGILSMVDNVLYHPDSIRKTSILLQLLPIFNSIEVYQTAELLETTNRIARRVAIGLYTPEPPQIDTVFSFCQNLSKNSMWQVRCAMIHFLSVYTLHTRNYFSDAEVQSATLMLIHHLVDERAEVYNLATQVLSNLFSIETNLLQYAHAFLTDIYVNKKIPQFSWMQESLPLPTLGSNPRQIHRGIYGISSIISAFPFSVPLPIPDLLQALTTRHPRNSMAIQTISKFKQTHKDNWQKFQTLFTKEQLQMLQDTLVSPHFYA